MLYLSRKVGESIVINNNITVTVQEVKGRAVKLGFTFPPEVSILRSEVHERVREENSAAMLSEFEWLDSDMMFDEQDDTATAGDESASS